ncbi:hypothetical protein TNCT_210391 [Trichonephila clavata]|uniref:Uncharacterized protein n=1 Tax=Trichonephila clavata TaxID=2740835 RepID=A0A8X6HFM5_TRICU|nr:hypothetical protein TNCT_210391 [Trichonephila clavata]
MQECIRQRNEIYLFEVGRRYSVCGVYPAVGVDDVRRNVMSVDAVDGIPHILLGGHHDTKREEHQHGERVVQSEDFIVDVGSSHLHEALEAAKNIQHGRAETHLTVTSISGRTSTLDFR